LFGEGRKEKADSRRDQDIAIPVGEMDPFIGWKKKKKKKRERGGELSCDEGERGQEGENPSCLYYRERR